MVNLDIRVAAAAAICLAIAGAMAMAQTSGDPVRGQAYAEMHCSACHAVGNTGESDYPPAPQFRNLSLRYPIENLAEALAEGIGVGHAGPVQMPEFVLSPEEIDDLLAYFVSLEPDAGLEPRP